MAERPKIDLERPADVVEVEAPAPKSGGGGGIKAFLPLIITIVLMPAVAWAMTTFVLVPKLKKSMGIAPAQAEHAKPGAGEKEGAAAEHGSGEKGGTKETVTMTKLLVNVSGTMGSRYLLAGLTLSGSSGEFKTKIEKNEAKLRDMVCTILATKTINDLEKPGARNLMRSELLTGFNNILGGETVEEIYITEFAIQ